MKSQFTIRTRLALTGALLMAMFLTLGSVALFGLRGLQHTVGQLTDQALPGLLAFSKVEATLNEMRGDVLKHIGSSNPETKKAAEENIQKLRQTVAQQLRDYDKTISDEENRRLFLKVGPAFEHYY